MREWLDEFARDQHRRGLSDSTIQARRYVLNRALRFGLDLAQAEPCEIEDFIDSRNLGKRARYSYISHLHTFYEWAIRAGRLEHDPTVRIMRPRLPRRLPRPIPRGQLQLALEYAQPDMRAMLLGAAYEGLRCHEIAGLERSDLLDSADPPILVVRRGKGDHQRAVPLHPAFMMSVAAAQLPSAGALFRLVDGRPMRGHNVSHQGNQYLHDLGIDETMHTLRHWFATEVYKQTRDLRVVQELLGHASPATTAIYTAFAPEVAAIAVTKLTV